MMKDKIKSFISECIKEYPVEPDRIEVSISKRTGRVNVSLSCGDSPLYYMKEERLEAIKEREDFKVLALEVYGDNN